MRGSHGLEGNSPLQRILQHLGIWKNLGACRKPQQELPKNAVSSASAPPNRPIGLTRPRSAPPALRPRTQARPCPADLSASFQLSPEPKPSSILQDTVVLRPCQMGANHAADWRQRHVYGAALPERLDGSGQHCSRNAGNASQTGSRRLALTFTAIFKIPLPWWGWVAAGDLSFIWPHLSPEVTES